MLLGSLRTAFASYFAVKFWASLLRNFFAAFVTYFLIKFSSMSLSSFLSAFPSCFSNSHLALSTFFFTHTQKIVTSY
jgi:hypothetical protein